MRVGIVTNTAWNVTNFRLNLVRRIAAEGHSVVVLAGADPSLAALAREGVNFRRVPFRPASVNPLTELWTVFKLRQALKAEKVEVAFSYTPKGNLYCLMACVGLPVVCMPNISGMGSGFLRSDWISRLLLFMYRTLLVRARKVFFQNEEDQGNFLGAGLVMGDQAVLLPGSGIDLRRFSAEMAADASASRETSATFLMLSRALWDKGLSEYVQAARIIKGRHPGVRFKFAGSLNAENPSAVDYQTLQEWFSRGDVEYIGLLDDVRSAITASCCVVLPSYREGLSRTLLEAAALRKPVITTDSAGCRHAVIDGVTGLLCQARSVDSLVDAMEKMLALGGDGRVAMGLRARHHVEAHFDESLVHARYLEAISCAQAQSRLEDFSEKQTI